jgi:uncharacterized protein
VSEHETIDLTTKSVDVAGTRYVYLVETGEIFGESAESSNALPTEVDLRARARSSAPPPGRFESERVSLKTLSMSLLGECNLGCTYCYVFADHTPTPAATKMTVEEARRQVEFLFAQAGEDATRLTITFFGGEPFMNFPAMRAAAQHARERAAASGKSIGFTVTTNGTLLSPEAIEFLVEYDVQTTVSLDGDRESNDLRRTWTGQKTGSYDAIAPKVERLLAAFRHRPFKIGARATMTHDNCDVEHIVEHLLSMGFYEVAASVASVEQPEMAFTSADYASMNAGLARLADRFADEAIQGKHFGFSNVASLVKRFHEGSVRDYPCGATLGLVGSDSAGKLYVCHRFVGDDRYAVGTVEGGVDHAFRNRFIRGNSVRMKEYCAPCWLRHLCGGGCYHEAMVSGSHDFSKLTHICDNLRMFYEACLRAYIRIATENPAYLERLDPQIQRHVHEGHRTQT